MPNLFFADLVREMCDEGGTGALTPAGAVPGHRRFADAVPADTPFHYAIAGVALPGQWEVGQGRIDGEGRLQRDSVAASSEDAEPVDFAPGLKTLALTVGADWFGASDAAAAAAATALDAKQPVSTLHDVAASGVSGDLVTLRRGDGWVNLPLSALAYRGADGGHVLSGPLCAPTGSAAAPSLCFAGDADTGAYRAGTNMLGFAVGGQEVWRLSVDLATMTTPASWNGGLRMQKPGGPSPASIQWTMSHRSNNMDLLFFGSDGSTYRDYLKFDWLNAETRIGIGGTPTLCVGASHVRAGADNSVPLGQAAWRWATVYAGTGAINTSDARDKSWRDAPNVAELRAARRIACELGFFRWNDAIAAKGEAAARLHFGVEAQAVWAIMADEGLVEAIVPGVAPDSRYAFLCHDRWDESADGSEAGDRFGIRPDQLALFLIAGQEARIAALEAAA